MRILLYGENWEGTHVNCIAGVLEQHKIDFEIFDFYNIIHRRFRNRILNKVWREFNYSKNETLANQLFLKQFYDFKPDLVFISKGVNIFPETLYQIKTESVKIVNWNPDDFFNSSNNSEHLLNSLSIYDIVFSARKHLFDEYKSKGIYNPIYLDWYYIPSLHRKIERNIEIEKKVVFIGTHSKRREYIINSIDKKYQVEIWGSGWEYSKLKLKANIHIRKVLRQSDFPSIISNSLINLNILTKENRDQTNLKIFEITASNGLLLSEYTEASSEILSGGSNCLYYNIGMGEKDNLNEQIDWIFSAAVEDYEMIRNAGYEKIISNGHSINDKVDHILNHLSL